MTEDELYLGCMALKNELSVCDSVLIGAGAGLSASAGFLYSGERFKKEFSDFEEKYGISDMYSGGFCDFPTEEERWAFFSRLVYINRYRDEDNGTYKMLLDLVKDKDYFVITTNVDHLFQKAGFDKKRIFYTQGDYGLFQCSEPCHSRTYDNEEVIGRMYREQSDMKVPSELLPKCPVCGRPMVMNLRSDERFVEDEGWHDALGRYNGLVSSHVLKRTLLLELGVGMNTPGIIKYPFWRMADEFPNMTYACVNMGQAAVPREIEDKSVCINADIKRVLEILGGEGNEAC